ncbi:MAG: protease inhibitor I42 family protein [Clostridiales bacterium]
MRNDNTQDCALNLVKGSIFNIKLSSQVASTGLTWALSHMPDSINLVDLSIETNNSHLVGASETQVFTFVALFDGKAELKFNLLRPWEPEKIEDTRKFDLIITDSENEDLENIAGCKKFFSFADSCSLSGANMMYMPPYVMKYMAPAPVSKTQSYMGISKYMGPPVITILYMAPVDKKKDTKE